MRTEKLQSKHRALLVKFFNDLDGETLRNYTHFGYATDGRKASASIFRDLRSNRLTGYVLMVDGMFVGFGHLDFFTKREKQHVVKLGIVLHPRYQRKGFGKPLLDYMIADARRMGKEKIWLASYKDNSRAFELYRSRGFRVEGLFRKEEKVGKKYRDVISMALFLKKRRRGR